MTLSPHARVLTLAAGAAFLALLDVTVVNLAIRRVGPERALELLAHAVAVPVGGLRLPAA